MSHVDRPWIPKRPAHNHDSRSHDPFYQTKEWKSLRTTQLTIYPICAHCQKEGRIVPATVADHVEPRKQGGADELSNLQSLCASCHNKKSAKE